MPSIELQILKQPAIALVTLIAWLWLAWSLWHGFAHCCDLAGAALTHFLQ